MLGKTDLDLFPPESAQKYRHDDRRVIETGEVLEDVEENYGSDNQRVWYFLREGETQAPAGVRRAFDAVAGAIQAAADFVRPGVQGWEVDAVARRYIVEAGYPEYPHALGHSVGRHSHDGGVGFYPRWERYGDKPEFTINRDARMLTWTDGKYSIVMAFYEGGGRGVLEIGWDWEG